MIAPDTSVVVAAFGRWHAQHEAARALVSGSPRLIAHVACETYSVLTRLPGPRRVPGTLVVELLAHHFSDPPLVLDAEGHAELLRRMADRGIGGGSVYDALVGATARAAGATLVTLDARALATYRAVDVSVRPLES